MNIRTLIIKELTRIRYTLAPLKDVFLDHEYDTINSLFELKYTNKYTQYQIWQRAILKCQELDKIFNLHEGKCNVLEFGCGEGFTAYLLKYSGISIDLVDIEDWRHHSAKKLNFIKADITKSFASDKKYDLIYSYNTFEHILDPKKALINLRESLKSNGHIFLSFLPLYNSPFGLHAHNIIGIPYPQFIFSPKFLTEKLNEIGIHDLGRERDDLQPLNKFTFKDYEAAIDEAGFEISNIKKGYNYSYLRFFNKYLPYIKKNGLKFEDYFLSSLKLVLQKK